MSENARFQREEGDPPGSNAPGDEGNWFDQESADESEETPAWVNRYKLPPDQAHQVHFRPPADKNPNPRTPSTVRKSLSDFLTTSEAGVPQPAAFFGISLDEYTEKPDWYDNISWVMLSVAIGVIYASCVGTAALAIQVF